MRNQRWVGMSAALVSLMVVLAACAPSGSSPSAAASAAESTAASPSLAPVDFTACEVSDTGGIDDKGFNQNGYEGLQKAEAELRITIAFVESKAAADYAPNIKAMQDKPCDLIVTVGFLLGDDTKAAALANPDQLFAIVDYAYDPAIPNVRGLVFDTKSASMLQGYLAAGMTTTGKIGTFGGIQFGAVTDFMDGLVAGVNYYNKQKGTKVTVLGWNPATQTGTFTGDFENQDKGKQAAEALMQEGADIIFPVAGPVGLGAMAAVKDNLAGLSPAPMYIGVDVDQFISVSEFESIFLSSVLKRIDNAVFDSVKAALEGPWTDNLYIGTLANEGVGMAPFHNFESAVSAELKGEIDALKAALIDGSVKANDYSGAPPPA